VLEVRAVQKLLGAGRDRQTHARNMITT